MTSGLGLRWALNGPLMTNTLGGGASFAHFIDHLGPALKSWLDDMEAHKFDWGSKNTVEGLKDTVNAWVSQVDLKAVAGRRDVLLADLVRKKLDRVEES